MLGERLLKKIESLRNQPKAVRNQYAFGTALVGTLLVVLVWGVSLPARFSFEGTGNVAENTGSESFSDQVSTLQETISEGLDTIRTQAELIGSLSEEATTTSSTSSLDGVFGSVGTTTQTGNE